MGLSTQAHVKGLNIYIFLFIKKWIIFHPLIIVYKSMCNTLLVEVNDMVLCMYVYIYIYIYIYILVVV